MKTLLPLSAAALLLSAGVAMGHHGTTVAAIAIDGSCETFIFPVQKSVVTISENTTTGCATKYGVGVNGSSEAKRFGRAWVFAVHDADHPDTRYLYTFSYPIVGGTWMEYSTTDGESWSLVGSGTYSTTK
jgi:hypothetical protein